MQYDSSKYREAFKNAISLKSRSESTINNYCGHLDRFFLRFKYQISKATSAQLTEYILNSGSASTMAQVHTTLSLFYSLVLKRKVVERYIPYPDKAQYFPVVPTHAQMIEIISKEDNPKHRLIIRLLYATGIRVSELTNLKWSDIQRESGSNPLSLRIIGKGRKGRLLPLSNETLAELELYCKTYNLKCNSKTHYIFGGEKPYSIRSVQKVITNAGLYIGFDNLSPHDLRRSFCREQRKSGLDLGRLQELCGHAQISTTRLYSGVDNLEAKMLL